MSPLNVSWLEKECHHWLLYSIVDILCYYSIYQNIVSIASLLNDVLLHIQKGKNIKSRRGNRSSKATYLANWLFNPNVPHPSVDPLGMIRTFYVSCEMITTGTDIVEIRVKSLSLFLSKRTTSIPLIPIFPLFERYLTHFYANISI